MRDSKGMRILSFSEEWEKLRESEFTTFRFQRKDKNWYIGEFVKVVYKNRSKERKELGIAEIIGKEPKMILEDVSGEEAKKDGFQSISGMALWLRQKNRKYGDRIECEPMNKLTLQWVKRWL